MPPTFQKRAWAGSLAFSIQSPPCDCLTQGSSRQLPSPPGRSRVRAPPRIAATAAADHRSTRRCRAPPGGGGAARAGGGAWRSAGHRGDGCPAEAPQLRQKNSSARAPEAWNARRTKLRADKDMKTLRAHGFNQRPRFEQVVGYLEWSEPLPLDQPDRKATSFVTSHFYLRAVQRGPQPSASAAHAGCWSTTEPALSRTTGRPAPWRATVRARPPSRSRRSGNGGAGCGPCRRRSLRPCVRRGLGAGQHALPASAGQRGRGRAGRPVRQQHERRRAASTLFAAFWQQHVRQPRKQPRLLAVWLPSPGAVQPHAAPFLGA